MTSKKLHILIFSLLLAMLLALQSCEKKPLKTPKKQDNKVKINRLILLGETKYQKMEFDSSYYYFNKVKSLCDVKKDTSEIIYSLLNIAAIEQNQGNYYESENTVNVFNVLPISSFTIAANSSIVTLTFPFPSCP